ncbi:two-component sensor histidine kinase [Tateyamaria omphalii]|uniref:sensor histidine kinase n=1 Tax=Tateyamaria omphalii TaxID=299262 RepID=UPI0016792512|nr:HAMP domain-containing sensor histidine kinase [Tateyamaria omphalii]GGX71538.1 two-component sensor histidine kinase [Tateyamaria omphalii]
MRSTTLFGVYAVVIVLLLGAFAGLTLYSLEKSRWWDARTQLAQESRTLHLRLEANVYRLFKQHGDALLIGNRDGGELEAELRSKIADNLVEIRKTIGREIQLSGEEEIEELDLLNEIEEEIQSINAAIATLTESGDPVETFLQIERLAALLDDDIDIELDRKIQAAVDEELEEVQEVLADADAFRTWNERLAYGLLVVLFGMLIIGGVSFNGQIRRPLIRLQQSINQLRNGDYSASVDLGGSREFRELGNILNSMGEAVAAREASRAEQKTQLEDQVATRTAELQKMIDKLELGEENRKRLMADISHELRTPLAIILGEADVTLRTSSNLNDDVSDTLARIRDSAKHTNQIVDDMLTVARHEAGQLRLDLVETDLRTVVHDAVSMFPGAVEIIEGDRPVLAPVDPVRLRQSILALLQNARRYGGPSISVSLEDDLVNNVITVEDDGPGLDSIEKEQAFNRFFRGSNASGHGVEGSGLGLPVVKSIVEAHGGAVELVDRSGGGLKVVIALPKESRLKEVSVGMLRKSA